MLIKFHCMFSGFIGLCWEHWNEKASGKTGFFSICEIDDTKIVICICFQYHIIPRHQIWRFCLKIKWKTETTQLSEKFQNPINNSQKQAKTIPHNTEIHDCSFSWLGTGASIKSVGVNLVLCLLWTQSSSIREDRRWIDYTKLWKRHTEYSFEEIPMVRLENLNDMRRANHYSKYEIDTSKGKR